MELSVNVEWLLNLCYPNHVNRTWVSMTNVLTRIPPEAYLLLCAVGLFFLFTLLWRKFFHHRGKIRAASRAITILKTIEHPAQQFGYLRKVDPFVYEEMLLTAIKDHGHKIKRNKKYTGDGGIDGRATINGHKVLIQAKRYRNHITAQHVLEFSELCRKSKRKGLFIHTGRSGKLARQHAKATHIEIVSGGRMLDLLTGKKFAVNWK